MGLSPAAGALACVAVVLIALVAAAIVALARLLTPRGAAAALRGPSDKHWSARLSAKREAAFAEHIAAYGRTFSMGPFVVTADPAAATRLFRSREHSLGRSWLYRLMAWVNPDSDGILFQEGDAWRVRHRVLAHLFSGGNVRRYSLAMFEAAVTVAAFHAGGAHARAAADECATGGGGGGLPPLGATARPGFDLLTAVRWASARVLLGAVLGVNPDAPRGRAIGRVVDAYARTALEVMADAETSAPGTAAAYVALLRLSARLRALVSAEVAAQRAEGAAFDASNAPAAARRLLGVEGGGGARDPDTVLRRLSTPPLPPAASARGDSAPGRAVDGAVADDDADAAAAAAPPASSSPPSSPPASAVPLRELAADVNHLHGAHKAGAFTVACALFELSAPRHADVRAALVEELVAVCGRPAAGTSLPDMLRQAADGIATAAAASAGGGSGGANTGGAAGGPPAWRPPDRADLESGRLPLLGAVWRETLRTHVVSLGVMRRVGAGGATIAVDSDTLVVPPPPLPAGAAAAGAAAAGAAAVPLHLPAGTEVLVLLHALHTDPATWGRDALEWRPERWLSPAVPGAPRALLPAPLGPFMPFLDGVRRCAGLHLAELEFAAYVYALIVATDCRALAALAAQPEGGAGAAAAAAVAAAGPPDGVLPGVDALLAVTDPTHKRSAVVVLAEEAAGGGRKAPAWHLRMRPDMFSAIDGRLPFSVMWR